jgi:hypothetical protein
VGAVDLDVPALRARDGTGARMTMKVSDLRPCDKCGGKIAPLFYRVRFTQALINPDAVNQFVGMHRFFGGKASAALVENFAPASTDAVLFFGDKDRSLEVELLICNDCFLNGGIDLAMLSEKRNAGRSVEEDGE